MSLQPYYIEGYQNGLQQDRKPFLLLDTAFPTLENAYVWRERLKKREGLQLVGRLRRVFATASIGVSGASPWTINTLYSNYVPAIVPEATAEIEPGSVIITIQAGPDIVFTDQGDGTLTSTTPGNSGTINYVTGIVVLTHTAGAGVATTASFAYFPGLPVMGIIQREISNINNEQTIFFDTTYAYTYASQNFQELIPGTTWTGNDSQFFWGTNYRGTNANDRLFFVTNFKQTDPIRYYDGISWTDFSPYVSRATPPNPAVDIILYQARILIPYYGRLVALNTFEGTEAGGAGASSNYFNRCRFSQIGNPLEADAWRSDQFGRGGFIDAPVNEEIISAVFFKNTLIVFFEKTTWQLRYVGEYGLPFIWERISSDFGAESTFSPVLFDEGVLAVGDRAIITSSGVNVQRIDEQVPDIVFSFRNSDNGHKRVHGIRDFQKELVYWCYPASQANLKFPTNSLVYNYRNNTFAIFRNTVTTFGKLGSPSSISWDSEDVTWDDDIVWDTFIQEEYLDTISGNQQGYIHFYEDPNSETINDSDVNAFDQESLSITAIDLTTTPIQLTVVNHNLIDFEVIYITGLNFINSLDSSVLDTDLNNNLYSIQVIDVDTISIFKWNFSITPQQYESNFSFTPTEATAVYMGGGQITLFPRLNVVTKDFNPFSKRGIQCKLAYVDFLTDSTPNASFTVNLFANNTFNSKSNLLIGQKNSETSLTPAGNILSITNANPCQVTTIEPHGLVNGYSVQFQQVRGMEVAGISQLNGFNFTIIVTGTNSFTLNGLDSSAFTVYEGGGYWVAQTYLYYVDGSSYDWHRFYAGATGNYFTLNFTYDDALMNTFSTHQQDWVMNAMQLWVREGGKGVF